MITLSFSNRPLLLLSSIDEFTCHKAPALYLCYIFISNYCVSVSLQAADGNVNVQSYNPFLIDDSEPPLLLDTDSPTNSHAKPIQDVLKFFQKDEDFLETERNINNVGEDKVNDKIQFNKSFNNVDDESAQYVSESITVINDSCNLNRSNDENNISNNKKAVPPPRPPPPKALEEKKIDLQEDARVTENETIHSTLNIKHDSISCQSNPETLPINSITPSVFTANEDLSVFSHNTGKFHTFIFIFSS